MTEDSYIVPKARLNCLPKTDIIILYVYKLQPFATRPHYSAISPYMRHVWCFSTIMPTSWDMIKHAFDLSQAFSDGI